MAEARHFPGPPRSRAGIPGWPRPAVRSATRSDQGDFASGAADVTRSTAAPVRRRWPYLATLPFGTASAVRSRFGPTGVSSMIPKRILVPERLRRPPATGWSWVDRRFLREHGDYLSREAVLLYLFLAAVADKHGLSFYSDNALSSRLRLPLPDLEKARQELLE